MRKGEGEGSGRISRLAHTGQHNCVRLNSVSTPRLTASLADDLLSIRTPRRNIERKQQPEDGLFDSRQESFLSKLVRLGE